MKDEENEKTVQGRFRKGKDIPAEIHTTGRSLWQDADNRRLQSVPGGEPVLLHFGGGNRLLKQNLAKAPPGRAPTARGHPPSGETSACDGKGKYEFKKMNNTAGTVSGQSLIPIENERINTNKKTKQYKHLNFTIMKKQILFLAFLVLAIVAGTNVFGQTTDTDFLSAQPTYCAPYTPLTCGQGDGLAPLPGVEYTYTIGSSSIGTLHWFVTDDVNIMTAQGTITTAIEPSDGSGSYILSADAAYNNTANTSPEVKITWKAFNGALPKNVLLVVYNVNDAKCTDNMEVYRIEPKYSFSLDIAAIAEDGASGGAGTEECANPIQTATYDGTSGTLTVDYGTNYVFFAVNASNWMTSWMPTQFSAKSDDTNSTVSVDGWAYPADAATTGAWNTVGTDAVLASAYPAGVSNNGFVSNACIIVRVKVEHGTTTENIANETINLTVNGEMVDPADGTTYSGYPDLDEPTAGTCASDLTTDNADYLITPRPAVTATDPTTFETKVPTGN